MSGEESEGSEQDEESELMKQVMGFNKFDTTKVCVLTTFRSLGAHPVRTFDCLCTLCMKNRVMLLVQGFLSGRQGGRPPPRKLLCPLPKMDHDQ